MTKTKRHFDLVDFMGNALTVVLGLVLTYTLCFFVFYMTDSALRNRQKQIDGCCAQCKDLSNKKGVNNEK